ncbi:MAG: GAF domain-containing protein [Desulfosporosinus sp.]|nr:GAF domain-containing protein [Desulfosporosinus sp.]
MLYYLRNIKSTVQQTADAIAAALKIEVEIADADLIRIAGTGKYKSQCGCPMNDGFVYRHVMKTGVPVIIDNPGFNELCQPCPCRGNCMEYAEVAIPIRIEDQIIGVIGLVSFNEEQTQRLMDNKQSLLLFWKRWLTFLLGRQLKSNKIMIATF